jgi:hypothetical protein
MAIWSLIGRRVRFVLLVLDALYSVATRGDMGARRVGRCCAAVASQRSASDH